LNAKEKGLWKCVDYFRLVICICDCFFGFSFWAIWSIVKGVIRLMGLCVCGFIYIEQFGGLIRAMYNAIWKFI